MTLNQTPDIATFQPQNPTFSHCTLGWKSCTCFACAMLLDIVFFGDRIPTGCAIRTYTGDHVGGTTIPQVAAVARAHYGVILEQHTGANVCRPSYAAKQVRAGRPFILQGSTRALLNTPQRSTATAINHCVIVMKVRGGTADAPQAAFVGDPAADHHRTWIAQGPQWWPWARVLAFAAELQPWGENDPRQLGAGKMYAAFAPPPRLVLRFGGSPTVPFPDDQVIHSSVAGRSANIRSRPTSMDAGFVVDHIPDGKRFVAYQRSRGVKPAGSASDVWFGDWTGTRWVHSSNLAGVGGVT